MFLCVTLVVVKLELNIFIHTDVRVWSLSAAQCVFDYMNLSVRLMENRKHWLKAEVELTVVL